MIESLYFVLWFSFLLSLFLYLYCMINLLLLYNTFYAKHYITLVI